MPRTKDYNIREATEEDIFELTLLAREAFEDLPEKDHVKFNAKKVGTLVETVVGKDPFLVLVLEQDEEPVGYFFGMVVDYYFALESQAICLSWFIRPNHRSVRNALSLLKRYEEWGSGQEVVSVNMVNIKISSPKVFEKLGYQMTETTFVKRIT